MIKPRFENTNPTPTFIETTARKYNSAFRGGASTVVNPKNQHLSTPPPQSPDRSNSDDLDDQQIDNDDEKSDGQSNNMETTTTHSGKVSASDTPNVIRTVSTITGTANMSTTSPPRGGNERKAHSPQAMTPINGREIDSRTKDYSKVGDDKTMVTTPSTRTTEKQPAETQKTTTNMHVTVPQMKNKQSSGKGPGHSLLTLTKTESPVIPSSKGNSKSFVRGTKPISSTGSEFRENDRSNEKLDKDRSTLEEISIPRVYKDRNGTDANKDVQTEKNEQKNNHETRRKEQPIDRLYQTERVLNSSSIDNTVFETSYGKENGTRKSNRPSTIKGTYGNSRFVTSIHNSKHGNNNRGSFGKGTIQTTPKTVQYKTTMTTDFSKTRENGDFSNNGPHSNSKGRVDRERTSSILDTGNTPGVSKTQGNGVLSNNGPFSNRKHQLNHDRTSGILDTGNIPESRNADTNGEKKPGSDVRSGVDGDSINHESGKSKSKHLPKHRYNKVHKSSTKSLKPAIDDIVTIRNPHVIVDKKNVDDGNIVDVNSRGKGNTNGESIHAYIDQSEHAHTVSPVPRMTDFTTQKVMTTTVVHVRHTIFVHGSFPRTSYSTRKLENMYSSVPEKRRTTTERYDTTPPPRSPVTSESEYNNLTATST